MDEVQRKLEIIDRQLGRRNLHERIISTCPLVFVAVGLILGILIQNTADLSVSMWFGLLALLALTVIIFFCVPRFNASGRYVTAYLTLGCFVCVGAIRLTSYNRPQASDIRNLVTGERILATIRGSIVSEPQINKYPDWEFARFEPTDPGSSFYLKVTEIEAINGWEKATGTTRVQVGEPVLDLKVGEAIQAYCWLDRFQPPTNPGQFDTAAYLARRNVYVVVLVQSRAGVTVLDHPPSSAFARLKARVKQVATSALLSDVPQDESSRGLLQALLLGYRRDIDADTYLAFRKTGLLHLISLSGMHLGILFGVVWLMCGIAGFLKPARAVICAIAIGVFLLIVPPRAPTVRAAIIAWVFCAAILLRRHSNAINTLSLAAIILLLVRPTELFEAGWQLSFASVLSITLFTERIEGFMHGEDSHRQPLKGYLAVLPDPRSLFALGLAAWLGGAGILLYHFHTINPLTCIWTVLVFPLVSAILCIGFLKMVLFFVLPTLSSVLGNAVIYLSGAFTWIVRQLARVGVSQILIGRVSLAPVLLYYGFIGFAGFAVFRRPFVKRTVVMAAIPVMVIYLGAAKWQPSQRGDLVMTCLDVGHGQAILLRLPDGENVLFDAGSLHRADIGARIVAPYLEHAGIDKIDAIIISHNDVDHINGIPEIVKRCEVEDVYANDAFFDETDTWGTATFLRDWLDERGLGVEHVRGDLKLAQGISVRILWPDEEIGDDETLGDNDKSLVSLIEFAGIRILLCSDIEEFAQKELLRRHPNLRADAVVVPHHGSTNTLVPEFLEKLDARILICSCDRSQYERSNDTLIRETGSKLFHTSEDGAITVRVTKDGVLQTERFVE